MLFQPCSCNCSVLRCSKMASIVGLMGVTLGAIAVEHTLVAVRAAAEKIDNIREEASFIFLFSEHTQKLQQKLRGLQLYLKDVDRASQTEEPEPIMIKQWIRDLDAAALDSQDIVALCTVKGFRGSSSAASSSSSPFTRYTLCGYIKKLKLICSLFSEIRQINAILDDLEARAGALKLLKETSISIPRTGSSSSASQSHPPDCWRWADLIFSEHNSVEYNYNPATEDEYNSSLDFGSDPVQYISVSEDSNHYVINKIMDLFNHHSAVAVLGMCGSGKTRLLHHVSNAMKQGNQFQTHIWLCLSDTSTVRRLQFDVLRILGVAKEVQGDSEQAFQEVINESLQDKKYFLVLDNVCDQEGFENNHGRVKAMLRKVGLPMHANCKVLLSTRSYDVAFEFGAFIYHMPLLSEEESERLLLKHLFPLCTVEWRLLGADQYALIKEFLKHCCGLPLAIFAIAGLLKHQHPQDWPSTLQQFGSSSSAFPANFDAEVALFTGVRLGFNALEYRVKPCFGVLGIFAEDEEIDSEKLIGMWKAEGLVFTHDEGLSMLKYLSNRCLVQLLHAREFPSGKYIVKLPGLLHALAVSIFIERGGEGNVFDLWEMYQQRIKGQQISRATLSKTDVMSIPTKFKCPPVRALRLNRNQGLKDIPTNFLESAAGLRTLDLNKSKIEKLPDVVKKLKFLKFLDISESHICNLPDCLRYLKLLEYLYVSVVDVVVPSWIAELQCLTHFSSKSSPLMFVYWNNINKKLKCLEVLRNIPILVGAGPSCIMDRWSWNDLSSLSQLRVASLLIREFHGSFAPPNSLNALSLELEESSTPATLPNEWQMLDRLVSLHVTNIDFPNRVLGFQRLQSLSIDGDFPADISRLPELRHLDLRQRNQRVAEEHGIGTALLEELPREYGNEGAFPKLHTLRLRNLEGLRVLPMIEEGCMPFLKVLKIYNCPNLNNASGWKEKVRTLERLVISRSNESLTELVNSFQESTKRC